MDKWHLSRTFMQKHLFYSQNLCKSQIFGIKQAFLCKKISTIQKKAVPLQQQIPPRELRQRTRVELFYIMGLHYTKQPLPYEQQLQCLKARGLHIATMLVYGIVNLSIKNSKV